MTVCMFINLICIHAIIIMLSETLTQTDKVESLVVLCKQKVWRPLLYWYSGKSGGPLLYWYWYFTSTARSLSRHRLAVLAIHPEYTMYAARSHLTTILGVQTPYPLTYIGTWRCPQNIDHTKKEEKKPWLIARVHNIMSSKLMEKKAAPPSHLPTSLYFPHVYHSAVVHPHTCARHILE